MKACSAEFCLVLATLLLATSCVHATRSEPKLASPPGQTGSISFSEQEVKQFYLKHREQLFDTPRRVRVKAIIAPTVEQAVQARQRAESGEDFDELIAEYFVPYFFANRNKSRYINKQVDFEWIEPDGFWRGDESTGPLSSLHVGDISRVCPLFGKEPEFCVLKIIAEKPAATASLDDVQDEVYSRMWKTLADESLLQEINLGKNPWCGTCRAGHNINGQLWHLAEKYSEQGDNHKAVSACLLALREERLPHNYGGPTENEQGYYPEEQFLVDHGMDIMRYYAGVSAWAHMARIDDEKAVPLLVRNIASRGPRTKSSIHVLGTIKSVTAVPILEEMLADRHLSIVERGWSDKEAVYAYYHFRAAARDALRQMGLDPGEVKVVVGAMHGDPLPEGRQP